MMFMSIDLKLLADVYLRERYRFDEKGTCEDGIGAVIEYLRTHQEKTTLEAVQTFVAVYNKQAEQYGKNLCEREFVDDAIKAVLRESKDTNSQVDIHSEDQCKQTRQPVQEWEKDYKTAFELQKAASDGFKKLYEDLQVKHHALEEECYVLHEGAEQLRNASPARESGSPQPVNGICKCECNSYIRHIYGPQKLVCTQCKGQVTANPIDIESVDVPPETLIKFRCASPADCAYPNCFCKKTHIEGGES